MRKLLTTFGTFGFAAALFVMTDAVAPEQAQAQNYNAGPGFNVAWTLNPRDFPELYTRGPAFGARSVNVGMDFDRDGKREILFTTDETLAPEGPDPGFLDVYLYENDGPDSYSYVWHYTMPEGSNSLPALTWGDMDGDGLYEIYFGVPTLPDDPVDMFVFEQGEDFTFPSAPTLTYDFERTGDLDFRPSGFKLDDIDGDGATELAVQSRKSSNRELVILSLDSEGLDEFASFKIEFTAGEDLLGGGGTYDIEVVDFDGDGQKEIWYNTWDNWSMTIFEATGPDTYELQVDLNGIIPDIDPGSFNSHAMYFQDMDGDGFLEGWFPMTNGTLYFMDDVSDVSMLTVDNIWEVGHFNPLRRSRGGSVGDIDNDGLWDIVATHGTGEKVSRMEYNGIGDPADSTSYTWSIILDSSGESGERYYPLRIAPADMDGDGMKEIVLTNLFATQPDQDMIIVLEYDGSSDVQLAENWSDGGGVMNVSPDPSVIGADISARTAIGGFDLDQDGAKEIIVTDVSRAGVKVFEYNSEADVFEQTWESPADTAAGVNRRFGLNPRTVNVSDFDGDGNWEIVFPLASEPSGFYVYEWDGVQGSDNYGDVYSTIISTEVDTCCPGENFVSYRGDHERIDVKDIDGDGKQEALIPIRRNGGGGKRGTIITSVEGEIDHAAGGGGFETWVTEFFVDRINYGGGSPYQGLPADLDGDGSYEIVNHSWNNFALYNFDVLGADSYAAAPEDSETRFFQASATDDFSIFGGEAGDVDGNGDHEVYFSNFGDGNNSTSAVTASLWVIDYQSGDDVLSIDGTHVVKVADDVGRFHTSVFDVDRNGMPNIFVGGSYPRTITSTEMVGSDPRNPADYWTQVIYNGDGGVMRNITVTDSAGIVTTTFDNTAAFASKVQSNWHGNPIDFDDDGDYEILASFQGVSDSITTTTLTWNGASYDTVVTTAANERAYTVKRFEFSSMGVSVRESEVTFITPEDYVLEQNYPNPFNPSTTIQYTLPISKQVTVRIYNIMGQVVRTLVDDHIQQAGTHSIVWNATNDRGIRVASGTYIYSLEYGNVKKTKRMMLLK